MREYTAKYDTAALKGIEYSYRAADDAAAVRYASRKFSAWPNVTIYDDTDCERAAEGRVIYGAKIVMPVFND